MDKNLSWSEVDGSWQKGKACWDCRKGEGVQVTCLLEAATRKQPRLGRKDMGWGGGVDGETGEDP